MFHWTFSLHKILSKFWFISQVAIESYKLAHPYEDVTIEQGHAIRKDMYFDRDETHLFVMTDSKVRGALHITKEQERLRESLAHFCVACEA